MSWDKGTELRGSDGSYLWPHPMFGHEPESCRRYDGLTTVRDAVLGKPDVAHGTWVAQEARRLFAMHLSGQPVNMPDLVEMPNGETVRSFREVAARDLFASGDYLAKHGFRMSGLAADRGNVVHDLLHFYGRGNFLMEDDVPYWAEDRINEGDGTRPYRCDLDEATGYCRSLSRWLNATGFRIVASEIPGFNDELGYACTLDAMGVIESEGRLWIVDAKTRGASQRADALQLVAQLGCETFGVPGQDRRVARSELTQGLPIGIASLLVTPEKTTFRKIPDSEHPRLWSSWKAIIAIYRDLVRGEMPFETVKDLTVKEG